MQAVRSYPPDMRARPMSNDGPKVVARDLFAVPVVVCQWPGAERLNAELREAVMERFRSSPGVVVSNRNGWHSEVDLHKWSQPCVAELLAMIEEAAAKLVTHTNPGADQKYLENWTVPFAWANVNPAGGHNRAHNHIHGGGQISGVYYVDVGECDAPEKGGRLVFEDRSGAPQAKMPGSDLLSREWALTPTPGTLVLFPASQFHYVEPYRGNGYRISIAFNCWHPEFENLYYSDMLERGWWRINFRFLVLLKEKLPEKARALSLFARYALKEFGQSPTAKTSLFARLKAALAKAEVDASAEAEGTHIDVRKNTRVAKKNELI